MKKVIIAIMILIASVGIEAVKYYNQPDGSTLQSREEIVAEFPKGKDWKILVEQEFSGFIISGIYSRDGMSGIAVFEPVGNGKYKLYSREWRDQDDIVVTGITIDHMWHDIVWFNGAKTDYAEITYTFNGKTGETIRYKLKGMEIFINPVPAKDHRLNVVYCDPEGNQYK